MSSIERLPDREQSLGNGILPPSGVRFGTHWRDVTEKKMSCSEACVFSCNRGK